MHWMHNKIFKFKKNASICVGNVLFWFKPATTQICNGNVGKLIFIRHVKGVRIRFCQPPSRGNCSSCCVLGCHCQNKAAAFWKHGVYTFWDTVPENIFSLITCHWKRKQQTNASSVQRPWQWFKPYLKHHPVHIDTFSLSETLNDADLNNGSFLICVQIWSDKKQALIVSLCRLHLLSLISLLSGAGGGGCCRQRTAG